MWLCTHESNTLFLARYLLPFHNRSSQHRRRRKCMELPLKTLVNSGYKCVWNASQVQNLPSLVKLSFYCHANSCPPTSYCCSYHTSLHSTETCWCSPFQCVSFHMLSTVLNSENLYDHKHRSFLGCYNVLAGKHLLTIQTTAPPSKYLELFTCQQGLKTQKTWTSCNTGVTSSNLTLLNYVITLYHTARTLPTTLQLFLNWPIPYLHQHCL